MKVVIAIVLVLGLVSATNYEKEFLDFVMAHNKVYGDDAEVNQRFGIFKENLDKINEHNAKGLSWTLAVNEFADQTWEEFSASHLGLNMPLGIHRASAEGVDLSGLINAPSSIDWTQKGAVTAPKNQGQCGSCWSFSTTGSVEGAVAIKTGKLTSLSEQNLVDCSTANYGCNGGWMDSAFQFIINNGGLCTESAYPYTARQGTCSQSSCSKTSAISSYKDVQKYSESALLAAVALQPVSIAIEADQSSFQFYSGGVMTGSCGTSLDHGVLLVGYGTDNGTDYWKVKNSWGGNWGESGYIRLGRGLQSPYGQCGLTMAPSYPVA
jgi:C1A family cysteine protease